MFLVTSISSVLIFHSIFWEQKKISHFLLANENFDLRYDCYRFVIESLVRFIGTIRIRKQRTSCFTSRSCFRSWRGCSFCLVFFFSFPSFTCNPPLCWINSGSHFSEFRRAHEEDTFILEMYFRRVWFVPFPFFVSP